MSYAQKLRLPRGRGKKERERERRSYLHDPGFLSSSPPTVFFLSLASPFSAPRDSFFSSPCAGFVLRLRSYERGGSPCFCFNDIFSPRIGRESSSPRSLSLSLSLPLMFPLFPVLYQTLRSCSRRGGQPAESSRDFVDYNKCVCSSREYRSSSLVPSFYFSSSTFFPSLSLIIVLCCHRWLPIHPFGRTPPPPPPLQTTTA